MNPPPTRAPWGKPLNLQEIEKQRLLIESAYSAVLPTPIPKALGWRVMYTGPGFAVEAYVKGKFDPTRPPSSGARTQLGEPLLIDTFKECTLEAMIEHATVSTNLCKLMIP